MQNKEGFMKREYLIHFIFLVALFLFASLFRGWFELKYINLWIGGIIGTLLPDIDKLFYVYILRPKDILSQKVADTISQGQTVESVNQIVAMETESKSFIFHTVPFQLLFLVFAFLVVTSTGSLLGRGIVVAFCLHLIIDQTILIMEKGNFDSWFNKFPYQLDAQQKRFYYIMNVAALLIITFLV